MKIITILAAIVLVSCSEPLRITANPDNGAATSGTLGSAKVENTLPPTDKDTLVKRDTLPKPQ